jgi:hypothetical protein
MQKIPKMKDLVKKADTWLEKELLDKHYKKK